jgi:hypothetical protein
MCHVDFCDRKNFFLITSTTQVMAVVVHNFTIMQLFKKLSIAALMGMQAVSGATFASQTLAFAAPSKLPSVEVMQGFPDVAKINVAEYCSGKNVIIVGLPGAFTPT